MSEKLGSKGMIPPNPYNEHAWILGEPEIGKDVWIGAFTVIDGSGGLKIGDGCDISCGVHIYTHSTVKRCVSERKHPDVDRSPVEIGEHVFLGANAVILKGSKIGHHSVVGAGSLVLENTVVPPYSVVAGSPARVVRTGEEEIRKMWEGDQVS